MEKENMDAWEVNLEAMTCRNKNSNITVQFEKKNNKLTGKVSNLPDETLRLWVYYSEFFEMAAKTVTEAEKVFTKQFHKYEESRKKQERRKTKSGRLLFPFSAHRFKFKFLRSS